MNDPCAERVNPLRLAVGVGAEFGAAVGRHAAEFLDGVARITSEPLAVIPVPESVLDAPRFLRAIELPQGTLAIVANPIRARGLRRVLGWTDTKRRVAIVSSAGLDLADPGAVVRVAKLVAHEAGHLLGLRHCRTPTCLARHVPAQSDLDGLRGFCDRCRGLLGTWPSPN